MTHEPDHVKFDTLHVNLYGVPGTGKTALAQRLAGMLIMEGYQTLLVQEYAGELARRGDLIYRDQQTGELVEADQFVITAEQYRRQKEGEGRVQVVVTDSGLFTGMLFAPGSYAEELRSIVRQLTAGWNNFDVLLERDLSHDYTSLGRIQTPEESIALRPELDQILASERPDYLRLHVDGAVDRLFKLVCEAVGAPAPQRRTPFRP